MKKLSPATAPQHAMDVTGNMKTPVCRLLRADLELREVSGAL